MQRKPMNLREAGLYRQALRSSVGAAVLYTVALGPGLADEKKKMDSFVATPNRPALVPIPAGKFMMGSPPNEPHRFNNEGQHEVDLTRPYLMMETEVTQGQYAAVMGNNPSSARDNYSAGPCRNAGLGDDLPVYCVDWFDAVAYANRLSEREKLEKCYVVEESKMYWPKHQDPGNLQTRPIVEDKKALWSKRQDCKGYRLPTEAEWEYAARARQKFVYAGSDNVDEVAWYMKNSAEQIHSVKQEDKKANGWGLYGMSGNVNEWVWDYYGPYRLTKQSDPSGPPEGDRRVYRGGSWDAPAQAARVAYRAADPPNYRPFHLGFRLARSYP